MLVSPVLLLYDVDSRAGSRMKLRAGISSTFDIIETSDTGGQGVFRPSSVPQCSRLWRRPRR